MLNKKRGILILAHLLFFAGMLFAQNGAQISADELTYNFGNIQEADGPASHVFTIKNTGDGPLVITRVTVSCGCTRPEWTQEPIGPGQTGKVKVTYNPKGRPGPFHKTLSIYSNGKKGSYTLAIKGNVIMEPAQPVFVYPYSMGELKLQTKQILYSNVRPSETVGQKISVINEGKTSLTLHIGKLPHYLTVTANPAKLAPGEVGEISLLLDAKAVKRKGRITAEIPLTVESIGQKPVTQPLHVAANLIDNFEKLSAADKANAPVAQLSGTLLDFGKLPARGGFMSFIGGKVTGTLDITNTGKSPLIIYSATCDNDLVDVSGGKREIKPGATATFKISVRPREIKTKLEALINIVCNDPNGPVRLVKVTAEK